MYKLSSEHSQYMGSTNIDTNMKDRDFHFYKKQVFSYNDNSFLTTEAKIPSVPKVARPKKQKKQQTLSNDFGTLEL